MRRTSPSPEHLMGLGVLLILTTAAYGLGVHPMLRDRIERASLTSKHDTEVRRQRELLQQIDEIQRQREIAKTTRDAGSVDLKRASEINERLVSVRSLASKNELTMNGLRPGEVEYDEHYGIVRIRVEGQAPFGRILRFMRELRLEYPDFGVRSVHIDGDDREPRNAPTFQFELVWYVVKDGTAV